MQNEKERNEESNERNIKLFIYLLEEEVEDKLSFTV